MPFTRVSKLIFNKKTNILKLVLTSLFCIPFMVYGLIALNNIIKSSLVKASGEPIVTIGVVQKTGTAPFNGTCTVGGTVYIAGEDACDTDRVVRTLDTVEYSETVSVSVANATNVRIVHTLPTGMTWDFTTATLPVFCRTGNSFVPSSTVNGQTLICNLGSINAGITTTYPLVAKIKGDNLNGTTINTPAGSITATANTVITPGTATVPDLVVSASPKYDLITYPYRYVADTVALSQSGEPGAITNSTAIGIKMVGGKGSEILQQPFTFDVNLQYVSTAPSGQTFQGAKLYTWGGTVLACSKAPGLYGFPITDLGNLSCAQNGGSGATVKITVGGQDIAGNKAVSGFGTPTPLIDPLDVWVVSQAVRFWIPKTDMDLVPTGLQYRLVASNFNPVSASNVQNFTTGNELNTANNTSSAMSVSSANSGFVNRYDQANAVGYTNMGTVGYNAPLSVVLSNESLFNTWNNISLCKIIDTTKVSFVSAVIPPPTNSAYDISGVVYEYSNSVNPSINCGDSGPWYTDPNNVPGGLSTINRVRASNIQALKPGNGLQNTPVSGKQLLLIVTATILDNPNETAITTQASYKTSDFGTGTWTNIVSEMYRTGASTIYVTQLLARTAKTIVADPGNNTTTSTLAGKTTTYRLGYGTYSPGLTDPLLRTNITIRDLLAPGQTYLIGSSAVEPDSVAVQADGSTLLTWTKSVGYNLSTSANYIQYKAITGSFVPNGTVFQTRSQVTTVDDFTSTSYNFLSPTLNPSANCGYVITSCSYIPITVQNLASFNIEAVANSAFIEKSGTFTNTLKYGNLNGLSDIPSAEIINVFPFNNQTPPRNPATSFAGNLTFSGVTVSNGETVQYSKTAPDQIDGDPCGASNNPNGVAISSNPRCGGITGNGTGTTTWCNTLTGGNCPVSNSEVKAIRIITGILPKSISTGATIYPATVSFSTTGNQNNDIYNNLIQARAVGVPIATTSNSAVTQIKTGVISGNIFEDKDTNRSKNSPETGIIGIEVKLKTNDGLTTISTTTTDSSGNYTFTNLSSGGYKIVITPPNLSIPTIDPDFVGNSLNLDSSTLITLTFDTSTGVSSSLNNDFGYYVLSGQSLVCNSPKVVNQTTNCTLTLPANVNFGNLKGGIKIKISDGVETNCPAFPTSGNTLVCNSIPVGSLIGTHKPFYSLNGSTFISTGSTDVAVVNPIQNSNISSLLCSPNVVIVNGTTNCTITLSSGNFNNLTGGINVRIGLNGVIKNCPVTGNGFTLVCSGVEVGGTVGLLTSQYNTSGTVDTYANGNDITIVSPITIDDTSAVRVTCGDSTVLVNSTSTCVFVLPVNRILPNGFKLGIGDATPAGSCVVNGNNVSCSDVPTGSKIGLQPINAQIGSAAKTPTSYKVTVIDPITNDDVSSMNCSPSSINVGGVTDCTLALKAGLDFKDLVGNVDFRIGSTGTVKNCALPASGNALLCRGINVGNNIGSYPSQYRLNGSFTITTDTSSSVVTSASNTTTNSYINGNTITVSPINVLVSLVRSGGVALSLAAGSSLSVILIFTYLFLRKKRVEIENLRLS